MAMARFLKDPPLPGATNMARDEALLQACAADDARPVLRFYAWAEPTISLGYFQDYAEYESLPLPAGRLPVVRRTTGGGAILHDMEITYAIVMPLSHPLVCHRPNHLYQIAHEAVIEAVGHGVHVLGDGFDANGVPTTVNQQPSIVNRQSSTAPRPSTRRGGFFCFERRHALDIVIDDAQAPGGLSKLAGSAQRRTARAVLQHGSIILASRFTQHPVATWSALDAPLTFDEAADRLRPAFERALGLTLATDAWREADLQAAARHEHRYAGAPWTRHRKRH